MANLEVEKRCGCFTRAKLEGSLSFASKQEATKKAEEMLKTMNEDFCGKHKFKIVDDGQTIRIVEDEENQ